MSKIKFVSPTGKVIQLGAKAAQATSLRQMGFRPYDEVYAPVPEIAAPELDADEWEAIGREASEAAEAEASKEAWAAAEEKTKRGRPRKNTMSDADQA